MTNRNAWIAALHRPLLALACGLALPACGGGGGGGTDLAGSWDLVQISTTDSQGWFAASLIVAPDGKVTVTSNVDSTGNTTPPAAGFDLRIAVDANRNVTLGGADGDPTFHGTLSSSKTLVVGTATESAPTGYDLAILRKRVPGARFVASDVASFSFALHALQTGNSVGWQVGEGSTNASRQITVSSMLDAAGNSCSPTTTPCGLVDFDTIQVDTNGLVTTASDPTFHGVMTLDKNAIFAVSTTDTTPGFETYQFLAILRTGQTFAAADLAGTYGVHSLTGGATGAASAWFHAGVTVDAAGQVTFDSFLSSNGTAAPTGVVFTFDTATGIITQSGNAAFHGRLAHGKDFYVRTSGPATTPSLAVALK